MSTANINFHRLSFFVYVGLSLLILAIIVQMLLDFGYRITYSASASMPKGFYLITPIKRLARFDAVMFSPPPSAKDFILMHNWGPKSGFVLKYVYGVPGDMVCNRNNGILINQKLIANIYHYYAPGKKLPRTDFCAQLGQDQYFLLSTKIEHSFDSRYYGPIFRAAIVGKALKL